MEISQLDERPQNVCRKKLRLLLVEDSYSLQELARILIEKKGDDLTIVSNGLEALQCMSNCDFDVVFMDLHMPLMDGLTTLRFIRQFETGKKVAAPELKGIATQLVKRLQETHTYVVAVTANSHEKDKQSCFDAGVDDFLTKPYRINSFEKVLNRFVRTCICR